MSCLQFQLVSALPTVRLIAGRHRRNDSVVGSAADTVTVPAGGLNDILSDEDGPSFHRFQILAWTLVLSVIFIASVVQTLDMPDFSPTLLGLLGVSSGAYLGFKFPEQKKR
jgi:hypothetical protein